MAQAEPSSSFAAIHLLLCRFQVRCPQIISRMPPPNLLWPDPLPMLNVHKSHIRIILRHPPTTRKALVVSNDALLFLTAAIVEASNAIGVLWGPSDNLMPGRDFVTSFYRALKRNEPAMDIIARLVFVKTTNALAVATHGLNFLVGREIEFTPTPASTLTPEQMYDRVLQIASYLYIGATDEPRVLRPGELVGPERFRVEVANSGMIANEPIYRIVTTT